jgi:hypothetical protein
MSANPPAQQLDFESLMFPDRKVLYVSEVAGKLRVTEQHVIDLIEEGALQGVNAGGEFDSVRVPRGFIAVVAQRLGRTEAEVWQEVGRLKEASPRGRKTWRIPIEAWRAFLAGRHSFNVG